MNISGAIVCLICLIVLVISSTVAQECLEPEDIYPCYCEEDDGIPEMHCNHLTTQGQLNQSLQGSKGQKIWKISFLKNKIDSLMSDIFQGQNIQRLVFENSTFNMLEPQFLGLENSLSTFEISSCFDPTGPMRKWSLGHLLKLREINISKNKLLVLENDWLKEVNSNLRTVSLEENDIEKLGSKVFWKIHSLTFLFLGNNRLETLERSMFPLPANELRTININDNKIKSLPEDIFKGMPNLRTFEMENNFLITIEENVWGEHALSQLSVLRLKGNPIRCDFSLKWMYEIGKRRPSNLSGECDSPKRLKNRSLSSLSRREII